MAKPSHQTNRLSSHQTNRFQAFQAPDRMDVHALEDSCFVIRFVDFGGPCQYQYIILHPGQWDTPFMVCMLLEHEDVSDYVLLECMLENTSTIKIVKAQAFAYGWVDGPDVWLTGTDVFIGEDEGRVAIVREHVAHVLQSMFYKMNVDFTSTEDAHVQDFWDVIEWFQDCDQYRHRIVRSYSGLRIVGMDDAELPLQRDRIPAEALAWIENFERQQMKKQYEEKRAYREFSEGPALACKIQRAWRKSVIKRNMRRVWYAQKSLRTVFCSRWIRGHILQYGV